MFKALSSLLVGNVPVGSVPVENANEDYGDPHTNTIESTQTPHDAIYEALSDWSGTGRGSHVEFNKDENIPLHQGRFLGRGAVGDVHETIINGHALAWKRMIIKRKVNLNEKKEIEILKKLSHPHIVQLVGTYTYQRQLGILLYPVALCDLHTFFEDVEIYRAGEADESQRARLDALKYFDEVSDSSLGAWPIYTQVGCLISAVAYLHSQKIRHKDLKPSNILLSPGKLYLSDFGTATDFSLASQSATDNGGGTPRYFAPEVAEYKKAGRSADIFSLGCVLLEILVLQHEGTLERLRNNRSTGHPAFYANLDSLEAWLPPDDLDSMPHRDYHLLRAIKMMLSRDPNKRPKADQLLSDVALSDRMTNAESRSIFGSCCRISYVSTSVYEDAVSALNQDILSVKEERDSLRKLVENPVGLRSYDDLLEEMAEALRREVSFSSGEYPQRRLEHSARPYEAPVTKEISSDQCQSCKGDRFTYPLGPRGDVYCCTCGRQR